jgi:hypothetical protein
MMGAHLYQSLERIEQFPVFLGHPYFLRSLYKAFCARHPIEASGRDG